MSLLCIDNVPEGVVNYAPPVAKKTRRPAEEVRNGRTRCPDCCARLAYTDWDNPQKVIRLHQETECPALGFVTRSSRPVGQRSRGTRRRPNR